jgi:hypothetical protein
LPKANIVSSTGIYHPAVQARGKGEGHWRQKIVLIRGNKRESLCLAGRKVLILRLLFANYLFIHNFAVLYKKEAISRRGKVQFKFIINSQMSGIIGRKIGMTSVYGADGQVVACTVVEAGPCVVTQVKTEETDGYEAVQLGFGEKKEKTPPSRCWATSEKRTLRQRKN